MINLLARIHDTLFPRSCAMCGYRLGINEHTLCTVCNISLPRTDYAEAIDDNQMARMFWGLIPIKHCAALFFYKAGSEASQMVYNLKYNDSPETAEFLGAMLAEEYLSSGIFENIDVIVPVPLSRRRLRERGYNQSLYIARGISRITGIKVDGKAITRTRFQESQTHKQRWDRNANVDHAFRLNAPERMHGRHILLVDDVVTTGATLCACAKEIEKAGDTLFSILTLGYAKP